MQALQFALWKLLLTGSVVLKFIHIADRQFFPAPRLKHWQSAALLGALCFIAFQSQAADWRYRMRPGDNPWDIASKYLRSDVHSDRLLRHNKIQNPHTLPPGTVLSIPVDWLRHHPTTAEVIASKGLTETVLDGRKVQVQNGLKLPAGAVLRSASDASLTLAFADGSQVRMHGDSELSLVKLDSYGDTGIFNIHLRLPYGRISSLVRPRSQLASRYVVDTPGMMSSVRGTDFRSASDGKQSRTEVLGGEVAAGGGGRQVTLNAGLGSVSDENGRPSPPIKLLPAPDLSDIPAHILRLPATLAWKQVPGATHYRLQASLDENFQTLLLDTETERASTALDIQHEGTLHMRVRAVAANGLEGMDAVRRTEIAAQPSPPLVLSPLDDAQLSTRRPRLRWTTAEQKDLSYRIQIITANGNFDSPLFSQEGLHRADFRLSQDLAPGQYQWRIGANDANGKPGAWSLPMPFTILPPGQAATAGTSPDGGLKVHWDKMADDQKFRFQLASDAQFKKIRIDQVLEENTIYLPEIRSGTWYLRVMSVEEDGFEQMISPAQTVKLGCTTCRVIGAAGGVALLLILL